MTNVGGSAAEPAAAYPVQQTPPVAAPEVMTAGPNAAPAGAVAGYPGAYYVPAEPDRFTRFFTRLYTRSPRWAAPVAALACMGVGVGYTLLTDPTHSTADAIPTCLLKMTTGLDCPGCGGTRAMWFLLHGDVGAAARHHILFVFVLPFLLYLYVAWAVQHMFRWRLPQLRISTTTIGVVLAAWFVFTVLRNLPWAPFTWLYV
ncbi:DUF2752 domain-containing protein [Micromonospora sonneratiae]|uniref:DUF2752 domain-containing protein n=1 Tax=Micromonospora sonneratiae TaxID=1184706 RepID=A0ABW3YN65_9ACTN